MSQTNESDWSQKYRPKVMEDLILPPDLSAPLAKLAAGRGGPSMLFHGAPGMGKTTAASLINPEATVLLNCTLNNSVNMVKELEKTCSTVTLWGERRIVILDEADYLTEAAQASLRGAVEHLSQSNMFIMTANHPERLSAAIKSRFLPLSFDFLLTEEIKARILSLFERILEQEAAPPPSQFESETIIKQLFPDMRRMLKRLQLTTLR
jgi:replication-associated recombination protein RarA